MARTERAADGLIILRLQPGWESKPFDFEFAEEVAQVGSSSISSVDSIAFVSQELVTGSGDVVQGTPAISGTRVQVQLSAPANANGEHYKATCYAIDDQGNQLEKEGWLYVHDI